MATDTDVAPLDGKQPANGTISVTFETNSITNTPGIAGFRIYFSRGNILLVTNVNHQYDPPSLYQSPPPPLYQSPPGISV